MAAPNLMHGDRIERPVPKLLVYYALTALATLPLFPFFMTYLYFRYHTLRYRLDEEGLSMSWGILFRREIHLTYARIQDIHLVSNIGERWLGLARIQIQTASGSAGAQMTLEGIADHEAMRDFLYARLRGVSAPPAPTGPGDATAELDSALRELAAELRELKTSLEASRRPHV